MRPHCGRMPDGAAHRVFPCQRRLLRQCVDRGARWSDDRATRLGRECHAVVELLFGPRICLLVPRSAVDRFILAYCLPFLRAIEMGAPTEDDVADESSYRTVVTTVSFDQHGVGIGMPTMLADRVRRAEAGELTGLNDDVQGLLARLVTDTPGIDTVGTCFPRRGDDCDGLGAGAVAARLGSARREPHVRRVDGRSAAGPFHGAGCQSLSSK